MSRTSGIDWKISLARAVESRRHAVNFASPQVEDWGGRAGRLRRAPLLYVAAADPALRATLTAAMTAEGNRVQEEDNGMRMLAHLLAAAADPAIRRPSLVLTEARLPGIDGVEVLRRMHSFGDSPLFVVITPEADDRAFEEAACQSADYVMQMPIDLDLCREVVMALLNGATHAPPWRPGDLHHHR
jgi:CheY-like chemotaxis protein